MNRAEKLLPKLSEWQPAGAGRHSWSTDLDGWNLHLAVDRADSMSCLVWELTLSRTADAPAGLTLKAWAEGIVERVGGLMEDMKVYEIDPVADEAVLRSDSPSQRGATLAYYEVKLHGLRRAVVRRFTANTAKPGRDQSPFALTHEVMARLAEDIVG
ncbi:MAG TPA: hypothetical protein VGI99_14880 [Gemmataceae bacterium]|jgi:hypothetical protein